MNRKQLAEAITRLEAKPYCKPDAHTWVEVVGGKGHHEGYNSTVCIICHCYSSIRHNWSEPKHEARPAHTDTQIGRLK